MIAKVTCVRWAGRPLWHLGIRARAGDWHTFFDLTFARQGHILTTQLNGEPAATG
jgi:hypothetical protein